MIDRRLLKYLNDEKYEQIYDFINANINEKYNLNEIEVTFCKLFDKFLIEFYGYMTIRANVTNKEYYSENEFDNYYYIIFDGEINKEEVKLYNFKFAYDEPREINGIGLDNSFYPYIHKDNYSKIANDFINRYSKSYSADNPIDIDEVLKNIGLNLKFKKLSEDFKIFGKICLNGDDNEFEKDTIYVDVDAENLYGIGETSMFFTIIHECVHWFIHRKYFLFQSVINKEKNTSIECCFEKSNVEVIRNIEFQANKIASIILMPENDFRKKYFEFCRKYLPAEDEAQSTRFIIDELAIFYHVSKKAVLIQLNNIGYNNLVGIYEFIDDSYVEPYIFNIKNLEKDRNISYSISDFEFLKLYVFNSNFRNYINTGKYTRVDKHIVVNDKNYIYYDEYGNEKLTIYARNNIEKCCIPFEYEYNNSNKYYKESNSFCRTNNKNKENIERIGIPDEYFYSKNPSVENFLKDFIFVKDELEKMPTTFGETIKYVMKNRNITIEQAVERTGLSMRTINRLRSDKEKCSLESILAIIIGLKLPKIIGDELLRKAGYDIRTNNEEFIFYNLIYELKIISIEKANEIRLSMNKSPLSNGEVYE